LFSEVTNISQKFDINIFFYNIQLTHIIKKMFEQFSKATQNFLSITFLIVKS